MYPASRFPVKNLDELDEAFDDFVDDFPDVPSLMPAAHEMPGSHEMPGFQEPVPVFKMELEVPVARPPHAMIRTSSTANMAAVRPPAAPPPPPSILGDGRVFDGFEDDGLDIPLDIKAQPTSHSVVTTLSGLEMTAPASPAAPISSTQKAADLKPGIIAFAGFGLPPEKLGDTPAYALRVITRKWALRDDLRIARLRRIQDVSLYEAALRCADESAVTRGLALIAVSVIGALSAVVVAAAFLL